MKILIKVAAGVSLLMGANIGLAAHAINNGDAETGDTTGWVQSHPGDNNPDAVTNGFGVIAPDATGDTYYFYTAGDGFDAVGIGGSASLSQDVYVWGCGVEYLEGTMEVDGINAGSASDFPSIKLEFFDIYNNSLGSDITVPAITGVGVWDPFTTGAEDVLTNAFSMTLTLIGTDGGGDVYADVGFDNVELTSNGCLLDFGKISGKIQGTGGQRGQWSFAGSVGTDEDSGDVVGMIGVDYKSLKEYCEFTPDTDDGLDFFGTENVAIVEGDGDGGFECFDSDGPTNSGTFVMYLQNSDDTTNNSGGSGKDRGGVCIDASNDLYDIGDECNSNDDPVDLKNGNVHVDDDTSDD